MFNIYYVHYLLCLLYLLLAIVTFKLYKQLTHRLTLGFLLLSLGFISLAIPLALSAQWTALVWTIEGLAILLFACMQKQKLLVWSSGGLILFGFASFITSLDWVTFI